MHDTKTRIVEAGNRIFYESGFISVRVEDVLEAAGASRGSFYKFFDHKTNLAEEVLKSRASQYEDFLTESINQSSGFSEGITAVFTSLIEWDEIHGSHGCLFQTSKIELGDRQEIIAVAITHKQKVQKILHDFLLKHGGSEPDRGASSLMLLMEGAIALANVGSCKEHFSNALYTAKKIFEVE
ncbi:TetR/AcrR family transcriptional regulator [Marinomonas sp.]|nr:TetR/AcrR family transcriptional regulator [Marinomonas sp.]MDB4837318.1 TetR/AcrR family transcriptional regulator [Marinomonas sp.]